MADPDPATTGDAPRSEMLDLVISVPCPECKRPEGVRCITLDTHAPSNLVHRARALLWNQERDADPDPATTAANRGDTFHIEGIADKVHYHDNLEQKIVKLELLLKELRAEWDEFIDAQLALDGDDGE